VIQHFGSSEKKRLLLKVIVNNKILPLETRSLAANHLNEESNSPKRSITTVRKVCVLTGRAKGLIKKEKVSRLQFKGLIESGLLCGVRKSS
jgi:ribosomal protein S14